MKKGFDFSALTAAIHLIFVLSAVCFAAMLLSFGILALPALTSAFYVGKDVIYKRFDVYDSLSKRFITQLKQEMAMMRYFPIQLIIMLQAVGIYAAHRVNMIGLIYLLLPCMAFLTTLLIYVITYHVFYEKTPTVTEVIIAMFYRVRYMVTVWVLMILAFGLFKPAMLAALLLIGAALLILLETAAFLGIASFKKAKNCIGEEGMRYLGEDFLKKI